MGHAEECKKRIMKELERASDERIEHETATFFEYLEEEEERVALGEREDVTLSVGVTDVLNVERTVEEDVAEGERERAGDLVPEKEGCALNVANAVEDAEEEAEEEEEMVEMDERVAVKLTPPGVGDADADVSTTTE